METLYYSGNYHYADAYRVLDIVNQERGKEGLAPLAMDESLLESAMLRAVETCLDFSHTRPTGQDCFTANAKASGENIAAGSTSATGAMNQWMNSAGHRTNILNENYQYLGVGAAENGVLYWSQMFMSSPKLSGAYIPTKQGVTGDADYDGEVGINDAYLTLRAYSVVSAGASLPMNDLQKSNCDIDHDNTISLQDALRILTYYSYTSAGKTVSWSSIS